MDDNARKTDIVCELKYRLTRGRTRGTHAGPINGSFGEKYRDFLYSQLEPQVIVVIGWS